MDAKTLEALQGSVAKWEAIVANTGTNGGTSDCPLCQLYNVNRLFVDKCRGCPVMESTGLQLCDDTPYIEYERAEEDCCGDEELAELVPLAQAELDFLRSLLPAPSLTSPVETPNG